MGEPTLFQGPTGAVDNWRCVMSAGAGAASGWASSGIKCDAMTTPRLVVVIWAFGPIGAALSEGPRAWDLQGAEKTTESVPW